MSTRRIPKRNAPDRGNNASEGTRRQQQRTRKNTTNTDANPITILDEVCSELVSLAVSLAALARSRQTARMARLATDAYLLASAGQAFFYAVLEELTEADGQVAL
jgi:hypothetical protein